MNSERETDQIREEAAAWLALLRSDACSEEQHGDFALWLAADPRHTAAMDSLLDMWQDLEALAHLPAAAFPMEEAANESRRGLVASLALAASLVLGVALLPLWQGEDPHTANYQTAVGQQETITLADGSDVILNTDSRLSIQFDSDARTLQLHRGEAYFDVASDPERPFSVDTGKVTVTAIGTAFNIHRDDEDEATVTVTHGVVRVSERDAPNTRPANVEVLRANEAAAVSGSSIRTLRTVNVEQAVAWQRGELIATEMPLLELLHDLERYSDTTVLVGDTALATTTVSGVFRLEDPDATLKALAVSLDLELSYLDARTARLIKPRQ